MGTESAPGDGGERRANVRINRVLAVEIVGEDPSLRRFVVDISATGFRMVSEKRPQAGDWVKVRLLPKNLDAFIVTARVIWVREVGSSGLFEAGYQLDEVESAEAFDNFLRYLDSERLLIAPQGAPSLSFEEQMQLGSITSVELKRLGVLARICELFNSSYNLSEVMEMVLRVLVEATGAERSLLLLDRGGPELEVPVAYGLDAEPNRKYSTNVVERVMGSKEPLLSVDVSRDERLRGSTSLRLLGTRSILCVPVRTQTRDFGLLYLDNAVRAGVFTEAELQLCSIIAGLAAAALERAEYFSRLVQGEKMAALGTMMAGIVHELRNPLCSIIAVGELLKEQDRELAGTLVEEALRCRDLVGQLMDTARTDTGGYGPVDLAELVRSTLVLVGKQFQACAVELEVSLDESVPAVQGNADHLRQVLINLLSNALYEVRRQEGGRVEVRLLEQEGSVLLVVGDNGSGIPPHNLTRVFDPFFTTKPRGEGTGLGLAITHRIVADHGGSINAVTRAAGGALFTVELPASASQQQQAG